MSNKKIPMTPDEFKKHLATAEFNAEDYNACLIGYYTLYTQHQALVEAVDTEIDLLKRVNKYAEPGSRIYQIVNETIERLTALRRERE